MLGQFSPTVGAGMTKSPKRVLIVEDHDATRRALRGIFRVRGYDVATAATLTEALRLLDPPPDCIVLDLMLPDGRGEDLLRTVREANLPTTVTVCTGIEDLARLRGVERLRPDALLVKPVDVDTLFATCEGQWVDDGSV